MNVVSFVHSADPIPDPRLGVLLPDGGTLVDLQAGHFSMTERPSPLLRDAETFARAGAAALETARRVAAWVASQRPPGTTARLSDVRVLGELGSERAPVLRHVTPGAAPDGESI